MQWVAKRLEASHRAKRAALWRLGFRLQALELSHGPVHAWHRPAASPGARTRVFVHGFLGQATNWLSMVEALDARAPLVAGCRGRRDAGDAWLLDMPGHGVSPPPNLPSDAAAAGRATAFMQAALDDALAEIAQRSSASPQLVATSAGALMAARHLVGPQPAATRLAAICPLGAPMGDAWRRSMLQRFEGRAPPRRWAQPGHRPLPWVETVHQLAVQGMAQRPLQARLLAEFLHQPMLSPAEISRLPADSLVICGGRDSLLTPHTHRLFDRHLPSTARCLMMPSFDHLAVIFKARPIADELRGWEVLGGADG